MNINEKKAEIFYNLNTNFWVTANAGSGKTTQLVDRFLFLLKNGVKPEEIVCITYTIAATKEIKNRVLNIAKKNNFNIQEDQLNIFTIHSFCRKLLIENCLLDSNSEILNNNEFLFGKIIKEIIDKIDDNEDLLKVDQYLEKQGLKIIDELTKIKTITSFYELIKSIINNQLWFFSLFDKICDNKSTDILSCVEIGKIYKLLPKNLQHLVENNLNISREADELQKELMQQGLVENLTNEILNKGILSRSRKIKERFCENNVIDYSFLKNLKNWEDIVLNSDREPRKDIAKKCKFSTIKHIQKYFFDKNCQKSVNITYSVLCFSFVVLRMYQDIKKQMNINTYDDLLFQTFKSISSNCLFDKSIRNNGSNIRHLMLDEAQDTNPISWKIIKGIVETTKCNFFIVGDKKQSIYRFQGARVEEYEKNRDIFANISRNLGVPFNFDVQLNVSFRSIMPILDEADKLCNDSLENKNAFTGDSNESIKHYCCEEKLNKQPSGYVLDKNNAVFLENFDISDYNDSCSNDEDVVDGNKNKWLVRTEKLYQKQEKRKQKIHNIAERLYKYILANKYDINNNVIDWNKGFSNGVAIVFSHKSFGDKFVFDLSTELQNYYGVDVVTKPDIERCTIYYDDIVSILNFFVLQNDNMNLACLLKSEIFCFTDAMLSQLCLSGDEFSIESTLWRSLKQQVFIKKEEEQKRKFAVDTLCRVLECKSLAEVLDEIEKIVMDKATVNKKCKRYLRSLNLIKEYADKHLDQFDYDIRSFLLMLGADSSQDDRMLSEEEHDDETVLKVFFSTIHGVKGMEFDTVLYFDVEQGVSNKEGDKMMFFDDCFWYKTGGLKVKKYADYNSSFQELKTKIEQQELQDKNEKLRLKYVAITRAKRRIIYFHLSS